MTDSERAEPGLVVLALFASMIIESRVLMQES